jgi:hypothetical protein
MFVGFFTVSRFAPNCWALHDDSQSTFQSILHPIGGIFMLQMDARIAGRFAGIFSIIRGRGMALRLPAWATARVRPY